MDGGPQLTTPSTTTRPSSVPTTSKRCASEHDEQCALIDWARRVGSRKWPVLNWMYAVPNGGHRHPAVAAKLKAEGVTAGVPDVHLDTARHGYHGLKIEMKRRDARLSNISDDQQGWIEYYRSEGYFPAVCFGWDEARSIIEWYLT